MITDYYLAVGGQPKGPMTLEEILQENLQPDTLVWKTGLPSWVKAKEMPELSIAFEPVIETAEPEERIWFAMIGGNRRIGPLSVSELITEGLTPETPVWKAGMPDWQQANTQEELRKKFAERQAQSTQGYPGRETPPNPFSNNPQYDSNYYYKSQRQYHNPYHNPYENRNDNRYPSSLRTNWLPWAIGATVVGFFCSCIGAIFGIIGIVQANKANTLYSQGYDEAADRANSNAKIMTIIGYVFAGIGILATIFLKGFYSSLLNMY